MNIEPRTNIRILRNIPLDNTYEHTIKFASTTAQRQYFMSKQKYNLTDYTYQRVNLNVIRVSIPADYLLDCNYLMFQNTAYADDLGNAKWFYAFITAINYVNNDMSEIVYEIDVMQTWLEGEGLDYHFEQCLVQREHSETDLIGENINPENVDIGDYVLNTDSGVTYKALGGESFTNYWIAICSAPPSFSEQFSQLGSVYDNIFSGVKIVLFKPDSTQATNVRIYLAKFYKTPDNVIAMYQVPSALIDENQLERYQDTAGGTDFVGYVPIENTFHSNKLYVNGGAITNDTKIDGHTVRNKKLLTYPFNYYRVDNASGDTLQIKYEYCTNNTPEFLIEGTIMQPVNLCLRPIGYNRMSKSAVIRDSQTLNTEMLTINNFPICAWVSDTYRAWLAQNTVPSIINGVSRIATGFAGGMLMGNGGENINIGGQTTRTTSQKGGFTTISSQTQGGVNVPKGVIGAGLGAVTAIASYESAKYRAKLAPDEVHGALQSGNVNVSTGKQNFFGCRVSVNRKTAEIIDDYFDRFGYTTLRLKKPNTHSRPHWNYVKTIECNIQGSIPANAMATIIEIYNRGITFWHNPSEVGKYELDNSPQ